MDQIIQKLEKNISNSEKNKSSYWKKYLNQNTEYKDIFNPDIRIGKFQVKNHFSFIHNFFLKIIFGYEIFNSQSYRLYKSVFDLSKRRLDINTMRHILTFELLKKYIDPKRICIIGDGGLNAVLGAHLNFPGAKIFSVNLSESHIHEYLILKNLNYDLKNSVKLIDNINENLDNNLLYLVPSNLKNFLLNKKIDLFINIASFQEMSVDEIEAYFDIIKNNKSYLYTCNRELKILPNGDQIYFEKYPWGDCKYLFIENCNFHQKYYSLKFPFIKKYDGNHKHAFAKFD
ncbi:putative sugar O-methyltransferase [Candidatus Pelagibacter sp.]|nr:putative sugar O-methyltransferase [Candidatus Pelagibacter sp.]